MKYISHLNTAVHILEAYDGDMPFHHFLTAFFRQDKKFGSKDRKSISRLCYSLFRLGNAFPGWSPEHRIKAGLFLCTMEPDAVTRQLLEHPENLFALPMPEKWALLVTEYENGNISTDTQSVKIAASILPVPVSELSDEIDKHRFLFSFFEQPDLFIRIRPGKKDMVLKKLEDAGLSFEFLPPSAIRLPNTTDLNKYFEPDKEIVIQDYSSQLTGNFLPEPLHGNQLNIWDACAASGGKSIMAYDLLPGISLTVSDKRSSILVNLSDRFRRAGIRDYESFVCDLAAPGGLRLKTPPDLVIADLPCSGSGTWSRTPEQLMIFKRRRLGEYVTLQRRILDKIIPLIVPGGYLLFITCSVFKKENEDQLSFITSNYGSEIIRSAYLKGYGLRADTMFAALIRC